MINLLVETKESRVRIAKERAEGYTSSRTKAGTSKEWSIWAIPENPYPYLPYCIHGSSLIRLT